MCLLSYALMHLYHLFPQPQNNFKNFTLPVFLENENADAWFGFLVSEGSKGRLIFYFFAYRDFKYHGSRNMEEF